MKLYAGLVADVCNVVPGVPIFPLDPIGIAMKTLAKESRAP